MFFEFENAVANPNNGDVLDVSPNDVYENRESVKLIDVRRPDEYVGELSHAPGSELITLDSLPQRLDELPKDKTIIFICRSGARSAQATAFALSNGFKSAYNMAGGMILWNQLGLETKHNPNRP